MSLRLLILLAVLALVAGLVVGQLLRRQVDDAKADGGWFARLRKRVRRTIFEFALNRRKSASKEREKKDKKRDKERKDRR